jgi:hypothetical protein
MEYKMEILCHKHKTRLNCSIIENPSFQSKSTKDELKSTKSKRQKERERTKEREGEMERGREGERKE